MNFSIKHLDYAALGLVALTLVLGLIFIFHIHGSAETKIQQETRKRLAQTSDLEETQKHLKTLEKILAARQVALADMKHRIPASAGIGELLTRIQEQIRGRHLVLTRFSHQPPVKTLEFKKIPLQMSLEGRFLDLYGVLHDFETMDRVFRIESIHITRPENRETCTLEMMAAVFHE